VIWFHPPSNAGADLDLGAFPTMLNIRNLRPELLMALKTAGGGASASVVPGSWEEDSKSRRSEHLIIFLNHQEKS
jgi:hypothetical protein